MPREHETHGLAYQMYTGDYDGYVPFKEYNNDDTGWGKWFPSPMRNVLPTYLGGTMPEEVLGSEGYVYSHHGYAHAVNQRWQWYAYNQYWGGHASQFARGYLAVAERD